MSSIRTLAILILVTLRPLVGCADRANPAAPLVPGGFLVEDLGPMAWKANVTLGPLAPDPTGTGFVQLLFAFPGDDRTCRAPFEIVAVNLQTGAVSRTPASSQSGSVGWQVWRSIWGPDGKLYLGTNTPPHLICWDPKTQTARDLGRVWSDPKAVMVYSLALGTDGAIYGGGCNRSKAFRYDPKTGQFQDLGILGLPRTYGGPAYAYSIAADDRYVYVASGKIPWYIVAYDRTTGSQQNLLTFSQFDFPQVIQYPDGVYATVTIAATGGQKERREFYQLTGGKAIPLDSLPPRPQAPSPLPATARPEVFLDKSTAGQTHTVTLWYRLPAEKAAAPNPPPTDATPEQLLRWRPVTVPVPCQPYQVRRLALLPNGRLVGATGAYGDMFTFDPGTGQHEVLGQPTLLNIYSMLVSDGKLYFSGYPNTPLCVYDPLRPWTFGKDTPIIKAPDAQSPLSNPQRLLNFGTLFNTHYGYYMARDAQGRIYIGCHAERIRVGGGLAVYDPGTGQASGIGEPTLTNFDVSGLAATSDGRLIVYSSRVARDPLNPTLVPSAAKLFVYDPAVGRFTHEWMPLPDRTDLGHLATGAPGQVVGAAPNSTNGPTTLYAVDVATGKLLWQRQVPGLIARDAYTSASFSRGPDGQIWTFLGRTLVRIRPDTGEVTVVGTVSSGPGDMAFVGQDIYLSGQDSLRRIRGVVPVLRDH